MNEEKRTKQVAVRMTPETYKVISDIAKKQKWTVASTVNIILEQFCKDQKEIRL